VSRLGGVPAALLRACAALKRTLAARRWEGPRRLRPAIAARFRGVAWIETAELADWLQSQTKGPPLLLDARTREEYACSHLAGARRIDPGATRFDDLERADGAPIVAYCSVGYRSAAICRRLQRAGHTHVLNLAGGIFQWANEDRPLFSSDGRASDRRASAGPSSGGRSGERRVRAVHPFDRVWATLLRPERRAGNLDPGSSVGKAKDDPEENR
jgi:rhodanese-related sulfurtransferase